MEGVPEMDLTGRSCRSMWTAMHLGPQWQKGHLPRRYFGLGGVTGPLDDVMLIVSAGRTSKVAAVRPWWLGVPGGWGDNGCW